MREALRRIDVSGFGDSADAEFWVAVREALNEAGATETQIELLTTFLALFWMSEFLIRQAMGLSSDAERCQEQLELIAEHLVCTDVRVRIGRRRCDTGVEFPGRPRVH